MCSSSSTPSAIIKNAPDLSSLEYYHGQIDRKQAENRLNKNGQFLLRSSRSNGNEQLVLSCMHQMQHLHFIIHEAQNSVKQKKFFFENVQFATVPDLISHYMGGKNTITQSSGALITDPVCKPLIDIEHWSEHFSSEYVCKLYSKVSAIQLESSAKDSLKLGDKIILNAILQNDADVLAQSLFKSNLKFIGIDCFNSILNDDKWVIRSGLELLLLPDGTQIRKDLIVRHECMKYFVVKTILNETDSDLKSEIIHKWIEVANQMENIFNDHFGFGSIMCGLCFSKIHDSVIWKEFSLKYRDQANWFECNLRMKFSNHLNGICHHLSSSCLPFFIQLCHMMECCYIVDSVLLPSFNNNNLNESLSLENEYDKRIGLNNFSFEDILQLTEMSNQIIDNLTNFEKNAKLLLEQYSYSNTSLVLNEMFKTKFHIKYIFQKDDLKMNYDDFHKLELRLNQI